MLKWLDKILKIIFDYDTFIVILLSILAAIGIYINT